MSSADRVALSSEPVARPLRGLRRENCKLRNANYISCTRSFGRKLEGGGLGPKGRGDAGDTLRVGQESRGRVGASQRPPVARAIEVSGAGVRAGGDLNGRREALPPSPPPRRMRPRPLRALGGVGISPGDNRKQKAASLSSLRNVSFALHCVMVRHWCVEILMFVLRRDRRKRGSSREGRGRVTSGNIGAGLSQPARAPSSASTSARRGVTMCGARR